MYGYITISCCLLSISLRRDDDMDQWDSAAIMEGICCDISDGTGDGHIRTATARGAATVNSIYKNFKTILR